ncbi:hypothetical protein [Tumebacillus lipolyticus]|uniref:Uncharacterized protein n=1 Tax=Tumebacillus lipolyticus TaxID=1280370 RepID=A0ABW5A1F9_9BACL
MSYQSKTDWQHDEVVTEQDMNRIEGEIEESHQRLDALTSEQIGAETPAGAQVKVDEHAGRATGAHKASAIHIEDAGGHFISTDVEGALTEVFTHGVDGKAQVAAAINAKGGTVPGSAPHSFAELAAGVGGIVTGKRWASGTVTSSSTNIITVRGLMFKPSLLILFWRGGQEYYRKVYHPHTDFPVSYYESGTGWVMKNINLNWAFGRADSSPGFSPGIWQSNYWTIFNDGFETYIAFSNTSVTWYAYE